LLLRRVSGPRELKLRRAANEQGIGAGAFFIPYFLLETPSNLVLLKMGTSRWIARIMFTWGILSACMALILNDWSFYTVRFLFGAAAAGLPGHFVLPDAVFSRRLSRAHGQHVHRGDSGVRSDRCAAVHLDPVYGWLPGT
jgi:hypothetical protein